MKKAYVIKNNKIQEADDKEVDIELPSWVSLAGSHMAMVPLSSNAQTQRGFYAARFANQAMPVADREQPLVQALDPESPDGHSFEREFGRRMGARFYDGDEDGVVESVDDDNISVKTGTGKRVDIPVYNNFQFNRKTYIHNRPVVKPGDKVSPGSIVAASNYTDDEGVVSLGRNARIALVPYKGYSMDDAIVISRRFADKMRSQHNYEHDIQKDPATKFGKQHFSSLFPRKFTTEQLDTLDEDGMVKPGTVLHKGDPILLATRPKPVYSGAEHLGKLGKVFRSIRSDASEIWEHDYPGIVSDSVNGRKNMKVYVRADVPMQVGDKFVLRNGQKCYHPDTEVLTERGWIRVGDVRMDDKVKSLFDFNAGVDGAAQELHAEFVNPVCKTSYRFDGELFCFENKNFAYAVTGNHRVWCKLPGTDRFRAEEAEAVHGLERMFMGWGWRNDEYVNTASVCTKTDPGYYKMEYHGDVHCIQVPGEGVILTRYHGKVMWNGNSIVSKILDDNEMLRSLDGKPFDILLNPLSLPSRVNMATLYEMAIGKVAAKNGKPIVVPSYVNPGESRLEQVKKMLSDAGLTAAEEVFDPQTGKKLERPVSTGMAYAYKLHHVVESKESARGNGGYDINEQPLKGGSEQAQAKRLGGLETTALMAKGGYSVIRDGATVRGQRNEDYWRSVRQGYRPAPPDTPFVFDKFKALLNGAGYIARDLGKGTLRLSPMTDRDLDSRNPIEVESGKTVKPDTLAAIPGGLFDERLVAGNRWGSIKLPYVFPNPAMESNICLLLGIREDDLRKVIAGKMTLEEAQGK